LNETILDNLLNPLFWALDLIIVKDIYDDVIKTAKETLVTSYTRRLYDQYDIYNIDDSAYEFHKEHIDEIIKELKLLFPDSEIYYGHKVQDIDHRVYEVLVKVPNIGYLSELSFIRINWT
jgi:enolase